MIVRGVNVCGIQWLRTIIHTEKTSCILEGRRANASHTLQLTAIFESAIFDPMVNNVLGPSSVHTRHLSQELDGCRIHVHSYTRDARLHHFQ